MKKRVKIPTNSAEMVALAMRVREKHLTDGEASVLKILNWQRLEPGLAEAYALQERSEQLKRELLEIYQKRDLRITFVEQFLRNSRDILTGAFSDEMKVLGKWGYDVLETRSKKSPSLEANTKTLPQLTE